MREGLMDDVGYHGYDRECPEHPTKENCNDCAYWNKNDYCEQVFSETVYDDMASAVVLFIAQCGEMAEQNWCPAQVEMLQRLFGAVLKGCEYADYEIGAEQ